MAEIAAGATIGDVAKRYGVPRGTVAHWSPSSARGEAKIAKIANLHDLENVFRSHLALQFAALDAIVQKVADAKWLDKQTAADLGPLYTTLFTKSGKLLGALYGPPASQLDDPDPGDDPRSASETD